MQAKQIVCNVLSYCKVEESEVRVTGKQCGDCCTVSPTNATEREAQMTGANTGSMSRYVRTRNGRELPPPQKPAYRSGRLTGAGGALDDFNICAVKKIVYGMNQNDDRVTLDLLRQCRAVAAVPCHNKVLSSVLY